MNVRTNGDLVQKALMIIYQKYKELEFEKGILPWAYTILDNVMKADYQTEIRRDTILTDNIDHLLEIYGNKKSAADEVSYQELVDEIWQALNRLSNKEKQIFELKLKGYSGVEIKNRLGLKRNTMDVTIFRGTKKLKQILEKRGVI